MDKPFNEKVQQFKKFKEEQRAYLEALKEGSSAKEKAEVEKMGKPEPQAKPFPYRLTAEVAAQAQVSVHDRRYPDFQNLKQL